MLDFPNIFDRKWDFSLRSMLIIASAICVALAIFLPNDRGWHRGLLLVATSCVAAGVLQQAVDVLRALAVAHHRTAGFRFAWYFAATWRVLLAVAIVAYWTVNGLVAGKLLWLHTNEYWGFSNTRAYLQAILGLALVITMSNTPAGARLLAPGKRLRGIWKILAVVASATWFVLAFFASGWVPALVHFSIHAIENAGTGWFQGVEITFAPFQARRFPAWPCWHLPSRPVTS